MLVRIVNPLQCNEGSGLDLDMGQPPGTMEKNASHEICLLPEVERGLKKDHKKQNNSPLFSIYLKHRRLNKQIKGLRFLLTFKSFSICSIQTTKIILATMKAGYFTKMKMEKTFLSSQ